MEAKDELAAKRLDSEANYIDFLRKLNDKLSISRCLFEENVKLSKEMAKQYAHDLKKFASLMEERVCKEIDSVADRRRAENEALTSELAVVMPQASKIFEMMSNTHEEATLKARSDLLDLDSKVSEIGSPESIKAMETLCIEKSPELLTLLTKPPEKALCCALSIRPDSLELKLLGDPVIDHNLVRISIKLECLNGAALAKALYPEIRVAVRSGSEVLSPHNSIKELLNYRGTGLEIGRTHVCLEMCHPTTHYSEDIMISATLMRTEILGSPRVVTINNRWISLENGSKLLPRKKLSETLDQSDLAVLIPDKHSLSTIIENDREESLGAKESAIEKFLASLSPERTITSSTNGCMQVSEPAENVTLTNDPSSNLYEEDDVTLTGNSFAYDPEKPIENDYNLSPNSFEKYTKSVQERAEELLEVRKTFRKENWEPEDPLPWHNPALKKDKDVDLSDPKYVFSHIKSFKEFSLGDPCTMSLPQAIAKDHVKDLTYITDLGQNVVHLYEKWDYKGIWPPCRHFDAPRAIICIPPKLAVRVDEVGFDVLILDDNGLHGFKSTGEAKWQRPLLHKGHKYRGLAYHLESELVITTEKTPEGVCLVFVDIKSGELVRRIMLEPTCLSDYQMSRTKCCFLACFEDTVITTDYGLDCFYITSLRTKGTIAICSKISADKYLKGIMGVTTDPEGNILVAIGASDKHPDQSSSIELFSLNGVHRRTFSLSCSRPVGIFYANREFYIVDLSNKSVELFSLKDTSF